MTQAKRISVMPPGMSAGELEESDAGQAVDLGAGIVDEGADDASKKAKLPERAIRSEDGSITLPLLRPVEIKFTKNGQVTRSETVESLRLRELNGADMRIVLQASSDMQPVVTLARAADMTTQKMTVIFDRLGARDIAAATAIVSFLSE